MSEERPRPDDDPFAFAPDARDAGEAPAGDASPGGGGRDAAAASPDPAGAGREDEGPDAARVSPDEDGAATPTRDGEGGARRAARAATGADGTGAGSPGPAPRVPGGAPPAGDGGDDGAPSAPPGPPAPPRLSPDPVRAQAREAARAVGTRFVVVVGVLLVVLVGGSLLLGRGGDGPDEVRPGERLPVFAAPLATEPKLDSDFVNLAERADQGAAGRRPACSIRHPSVVTSCALLRRGPLVVVTYRPVDECLDVVDAVDRLVARTPGLTGLAVATGDDHDGAAETVRARRWALRAVYDVDGALSSRLGGAVCPLTLFVRADGTVARRVSGRPDPGELGRDAAALLAGGARPATTTPAAGR